MRTIIIYQVNLCLLIACILIASIPSTVIGHSGGLNSEGCHSGSIPYHCHKAGNSEGLEDKRPANLLEGDVTHVRDGDTIEVNGVPIRLAALDCPEKGTEEGDLALERMRAFYAVKVRCELTGAKTYDRLVGYCVANGEDLGLHMIRTTSCKIWRKYDVFNKY
jgi:endonuclease YncB( thermonuclease family)